MNVKEGNGQISSIGDLANDCSKSQDLSPKQVGQLIVEKAFVACRLDLCGPCGQFSAARSSRIQCPSGKPAPGQ